MQDSGNYAQLPVPLKGGLDLTSPRMLVEPGRLVDVLNYECVDTDGYKKIDGFERYDGGPSPSVTNLYSIRTTKSSGSALEIYAGQSCSISYTDEIDSTNRVVIVTCVRSYTGSGRWYLEFSPPVPLHLSTATYALIQNIPTGDEVSASTEAATNVDGYVDLTETTSLASSIVAADSVRDDVWALPGDVLPYALQLYKDSIHAVANCKFIYLAYDTASGASLDCSFYVGNYIRLGGSGALEGVIKDWKFLRGTFSSVGTTAGTRAWVKVLIHPTVPNGTAVTTTAAQIDRGDDAYDPADTITCWKYYSAIDVDGPTDTTDVWGGVLYKSLESTDSRSSTTNDWTQLDMGYEVAFNNGSSTIEPRELTLATTTDELNSVPQTVVATPRTTNDGGLYLNVTAAYSNSAASFPLADTDGELLASYAFDLTTANATGVYATCYETGWGTDGIAFSGLGLNVPDDAIVTGITVAARCFYNSASAVNPIYFHDVRLRVGGVTGANLANSGTAFQLTAANNTSANAVSMSYGGANHPWGFTSLTPADLNDDAFTLIMNPILGNAGFGFVGYLFWDVLTVTVTYFRPVGKLYFYNGTNEVEAKLVRLHLTKGSWAAGSAEGIAHVYDPIPNGTRNYIQVGDDLRLSTGGAKIADVTSVSGSFLPSHADLVASDRRFEIVRANYYLNTEWESIYGAHGLGNAWSYDSLYFRKIYTEYDTSLDKPTHICSYRNYLALGFQSGNMLLSAISGSKGPLPEEFRSTAGAREFVFVDRIHGFAEQADTSLGVFCKGSVHRLVLNPNAATPDNLFYQATISANSGCVEYTVASFGDTTLYCDQYGIRTVEQTDVYGDLLTRPISFPVSSWLRPRLSNKKYWEGHRDANKPLFAHCIKAKNQYRVWFDDGYVLCMNLNSKDDGPQFTFLRYGFNFGGSFVPLTPIAMSSSTDSTVTERLHVAHWNRLSTSAGAENSPTLFKYVFEMERGWSFDGQDFPARLTVNLSLLDSPYNFDSVRKAELHGLDYNNTTLFCGWGTKYSEELSYSGLSMGDTFTPAGRNVAAAVGTDYTPFSKVIQAATRGRPLLMKLKNSSTATGTEATSAIEPPHILQAVLLQYIPLRNEG